MITLRLSTQHEDAHLLLLRTTYRCSHHSIQYISGRLCNTVEKPTLVSKLEKKKKLTTDTWLCDARLDAIVFCFSLSYSLLTFLSTTVRSSPPIENYELLAAEHPARRRSLAATTYYVQVQPSQYIITVRVQQILLCQQQPKQVVLHPPTQNYELLTLCGRLCSTVPAIGSAPATMYAYQTAERKVRHCDCTSSSSSTYALQLLIRT